MLKATLKSLFAHKGRLALTVLSIVLGVAFVTGTYVYTDTTNAAFDDIFATAYEGVDIHVAGNSEFTLGEGVFFDESVAADISEVDGVARVEPSLITMGVQVIDAAGNTLGTPGAPGLGVGIDPGAEQVGVGIEIREGRVPTGPGEMLLDAGTATDGEFALGDPVPVATPTSPLQDFTLVGILGFGELDNIGGATFAVFEMGTAQDLFNRPGEISEVNVGIEPDADLDTVIAAIGAVVPDGVDAQSAQSAAEQDAGEIQEGLGFFTTFLLVFAFIALFVGTFIIYNTFQIVVAQRMRELALMRAIGSTRGQVLRTVLLEAVIVGIIASVIGILAGLGLAIALRAVFDAIGIALPASSLILAPRTIFIGLLLGVVVTAISATIPGIAASRVPPVAAMSAEAVAPRRRSLRWRAILGTVVLVTGAALILGGLGSDTTDTTLALSSVGTGALVMILGAYVLSALAARPVSSFVGAPFARLFGISGKLAQRNAGRSPRRTSATAAAIMVGTALITLALVLSFSLRAAVDEIFATGISAEVVVLPANQFSITGFPPVLADDIAALPEVEEVTRLATGPVFVADTESFVVAVDDNYADFFEIRDVVGSPDLEPGVALVTPGQAESNDWRVGDSIDIVFEATGPQRFTVGGIVDSPALGSLVIGREDFSTNFATDADSQIYVRLVDGVTPEEGRDIVAAAAEDVPAANVQTAEELVSSISDGVNAILGLVTGLLGIAVLVALIGVTNTMALAVIERTREIGLLRAVGLNQRQTRRMIRFEASIVSVFGALLGVVLGVFFGWAIVRALAAEGFGILVIPGWALALAVVVTGLLGVLFAIWPAHRASRLNVLEAISYE